MSDSKEIGKPSAGPWRVHVSEPVKTSSGFRTETLTGAAHYDAPYFAVVAADGAVVCDNADYYPQTVDPGNMSLIAAAPDLLEALEAAIECGMVPISSAHEGGATRHSRQVVVADMIRAAIARARGLSQ